MALIGTINRALLYRATAYYVGGNPITVLNAQGNVIIGALPPAAPTISGTIADRVYEVGSGPYTIALNEKFAGAGTYIVNPSNPNLSLSGATLTITPTATMPQTTISIVGRNGGGDSPALTFTLTVNAVAPTVTTPLPDQNIAFGAANVTVPLDSHFAGVASYSVSPAANGATISGRNLVLSAAQTRSLDITVTGTNSTGQSVSDTFTFVVAQTTQAPTVTSIPTISGSTTVGSILTRTAGTATGIPTPTRATVWLRNGTIIAGQSGNTLDTTGFAAGDQITTRDDWSNTQGSASGTSAAWVLTSVQTLTASVVPNPIVMNEPFTVTFNTAPDSVTSSSNVTLTGTGTTRTGTGPATSPVTLGGTKAGYQPYSATITVDTAVITPNAAITTAQLYDGQTVGDIPNFATINSTSYFTRAGRTIASVQAKVGQMVSPGPDQPAVLSNLVNVTGATVLAENDKVVIDVTDSGGTMRRFELADVQYAVKITAQGQEYIVQVNDLIPAASSFTISFLGQTTTTSRAALLAGPVNHIPPAITGTAELGATLTKADDGKWLGLSAPTYANQWERDGAAISGATGESHIVVTADEGKAVTLDVSGTNAQGARTATSNTISIPAAGGGGGGNVPLTFVDLYELSNAAPAATIADIPVGAADANRYVWVAATLMSGGDPWSVSWTGVTINGAEAQFVGESKSYSGHVALYRLLVPTGTTVSVEATSSNARDNRTISVGTSVGASTPVFIGSGAVQGGAAATLTLNGAKAGGSVFAVVIGAGTDVPRTWSGATQVDANDKPYYTAVASATASGAGSATITYDTEGGGARLEMLLFAEAA